MRTEEAITKKSVFIYQYYSLTAEGMYGKLLMLTLTDRTFDRANPKARNLLHNYSAVSIW